MPYIRETMIAGDTIEIREFYTARFGKKGEKRERHKNESPLAMQIVNHRNSERKLRGLINANFAPEDLFVTLTYKRGSRVNEAKALDDAKKLLRKLKKYYTAEGKELKYVYVIELLTRTAHIHMVIPKIRVAWIKKTWLEVNGRGTEVKEVNGKYKFPKGTGVHCEWLWECDYATGLASYMLKEFDPRRESFEDEADRGSGKPSDSDRRFYRKPTGAKFHASRNLKKPEIIKEIMKRTKIPKQPYIKKGYILLPDSYYEGVCAFTGFEYRSYTLLRS